MKSNTSSKFVKVRELLSMLEKTVGWTKLQLGDKSVKYNPKRCWPKGSYGI